MKLDKTIKKACFNLVPNIDNRWINASVYKSAKKHMMNKGFVVQPRIILDENMPNIKIADTCDEPEICLNKRKTLGFFIFRRFTKTVLNHECAHQEQHILSKALDVTSERFNSDKKLSAFEEQYFRKNVRKINIFDFNTLDRACKLDNARKTYPDRNEYYKRYSRVKNLKYPKALRPILAPFRFLELKVLRMIAAQRFSRVNNANLIEKEAILQEENFGSVFKEIQK